MGRIARSLLGRIAAQGDDVANACVPIGSRDFVDFVARRPDAGQMRGWRQLGFPDDSFDRCVGPLAGRATRTIGYRHEARIERRQGLDRAPQRFGHRVGLRWKKFKADGNVAPRLGEQRRMAVQRDLAFPVHAARRSL